MLSPLGWLNAAAAVAVREIQRLYAHRRKSSSADSFRSFWVLVVWLLLETEL